MTIEAELQGGNLMEFGGGFDQFRVNLQQEEQILLQQQYPEKISQKLIQQWNPTTHTIDSHSPSHAVSFLVEMQIQQMDNYLKLQSERLRLLLQERRNHEMGSLLKRIESKTRVLFRQKDEEIARAKRRKIELEEFLTRLQTENEERQKAVQENEAMVVSLSNTLEQMREKLSSCFNNGANDAESINRGGDHNAIDDSKKMICRICGSRVSCVLILPCRHFCSCKPCEKVLDSCPVCSVTKKAAIEAVIF